MSNGAEMCLSLCLFRIYYIILCYYLVFHMLSYFISVSDFLCNTYIYVSLSISFLIYNFIRCFYFLIFHLI